MDFYFVKWLSDKIIRNFDNATAYEDQYRQGEEDYFRQDNQDNTENGIVGMSHDSFCVECIVQSRWNDTIQRGPQPGVHTLYGQIQRLTKSFLEWVLEFPSLRLS